MNKVKGRLMLSKKEVMELYNWLVGYRATTGVRVPVLGLLSNLKDDIKVLDVATGTGVETEMYRKALG